MTGDQTQTEARTTDPVSHAPSPWLIARDDPYFVYALGPTGVNSFWTHIQSSGTDRISPEQKKATARLIAAAPDLLDALKAAQRDLETVEREMQGIAPEAVSPALPLIRAAIAKAEGR